ncbi:MAG: ABC transporter permease [Bacteroidota bacterium]|jgi:ABC-2 type transport system permease protein|nr:ABC transporter permease [Bacteroidota bacterium]
MQPVLYLIQKEFRQFFREPALVILLFLAPLVQITLLGYAITTDVKQVDIVVADFDRGPMSRGLVGQLSTTEHFNLIGTEDDLRALPAWLDDGRAKLALVIPRNFQRDIVRGARPTVQLLVDGIDGNSAGVAMGYLLRIVQQHQATLVTSEPRLGASLRNLRLAEAEPRYWYNPTLESRVYIVPGIVALILLIITVFLTSMGIVREKEIGTLEQLMVSPIRAWQLILGKILPFSILGFIEMAIAMGLVYVIFGIGVQGSVLLLFAESAIFVLTTLGVGIFISTISETQQQALFVGWFFMIFAMLLSGYFMPIANMPDAIQYITYLNPLRYFLTILREIYLKGTPLQYLLPETFAMIVFGIGLFSLSVWRYRRVLK